MRVDVGGLHLGGGHWGAYGLRSEGSMRVEVRGQHEGGGQRAA